MKDKNKDEKKSGKGGSASAEKIQKKDKKETNGQTTQAQLFKKGKTKESNFNLRGRFMEAAVANDKTREIDVIIIQEGLGNARDKNFYTKECFEKSYKLFEGAQAYADHPTRTEESDRPERSIKELVGYYKNVQVIDYNNKKAIKATLKIMDGDSYNWIWDLVKESVNYAKEYPDKDLVGISINASGVTEKNQESADPLINYVQEITDVFSSDVVTKPGAGGRIGAGLRESVAKYLKAKAEKLQEAGKFMKKALEKAIEEIGNLKTKMEAGEVDAGAAPKVIDEIINNLKALVDGAGDDNEEATGDDAADAADKKDGKEPDGDEAVKEEAKEAAAKAKKEAAAGTDTEKEALRERATIAEGKIALMESSALVEKMLRESHLPAGTYNDLKKVLIGKDKNYIKEMIEARKEFLSTLLKTKVDGNGEMHVSESGAGKPAAGIFTGLPMKK